MQYLVIEVNNNKIVKRYGFHEGNTPGEAIATATVDLNLTTEEKKRMNNAWLLKSIFLITQRVFTSIKTGPNEINNEGAISSCANLYYVNCRKFIGRTKNETALYERMRFDENVTWHGSRGVMGNGGGSGYVGYVAFEEQADAHAYLKEMAFNIENLHELPANQH